MTCITVVTLVPILYALEPNLVKPTAIVPGTRQEQKCKPLLWTTHTGDDMGHRMMNRVNLRGVANIHGWEFRGAMGNRDKELRYFNNTYLSPYTELKPAGSMRAKDKGELLEKLKKKYPSGVPCDKAIHLEPSFAEDGEHVLAAYNDFQRSIVFNASNVTESLWSKPAKGMLRVAVHLRRGDALCNLYYSGMVTPNSFYVRLLKAIKREYADAELDITVFYMEPFSIDRCPKPKVGGKHRRRRTAKNETIEYKYPHGTQPKLEFDKRDFTDLGVRVNGADGKYAMNSLDAHIKCALEADIYIGGAGSFSKMLAMMRAKGIAILPYDVMKRYPLQLSNAAIYNETAGTMVIETAFGPVKLKDWSVKEALKKQEQVYSWIRSEPVPTYQGFELFASSLKGGSK